MIVWLTSYPKSGNTWIRSFLCSYFFLDLKKDSFNFNILKNIPSFPNKNLFLSHGINLKSFEDVAKSWLSIQKKINSNNKINFLKTHHSYTTLNNYHFTDKNNTLGAIYLVRDPRDVVVSYSKHFNISFDESIKSITNKNLINWTGFPKKNHYRVLVGSWDIHYRSWKALGVPSLVIKYETLLKETRKTINQIAEFFVQNYGFEFKNSEMKINNILETTSFELLQANEKKLGFIESPNLHSKKKSTDYFFRKGVGGQWEKELTRAQLKKIEDSFEATMKELGYLK